MGLYPGFVRHVLAPGYDWLRGTATMKRLAHLEESQWWPLERIEEQQAVHLQQLIARAYDDVPYYRRIMDERGLKPADIRSPSDLVKLPTLTKETIRTNFDRLFSQRVPSDQLRSGWSGGTTGERLNYHSTRRERFTYSYARWALTLEWTGVRLGEPHMSIRQQAEKSNGALLQRAGIRLQRLTKVDTMSVSEENLRQLVLLIRRIRPRVVFSYPSALALIAGYAKSAGLSCPLIDAMCVGGEELLPRQKDMLIAVFGGSPYVRYGSNELHEVAAQCEVCGGLHILAEDFVLEVVDDSEVPVAPGERGKFLITSLHNHGMPFVRYENGDIGRLLPQACACGRGLPLMDARVGRTREYLASRSGVCIAAMDLDMAPLLPPGVFQYQLVQEDYERFVLSVVPVAEPSSREWDTVRAKVVKMLGDTLGASVSVEVCLVGHIDMNLSGKRLSFVSRMDLTDHVADGSGAPGEATGHR